MNYGMKRGLCDGNLLLFTSYLLLFFRAAKVHIFRSDVPYCLMIFACSTSPEFPVISIKYSPLG